MTSTPLSLSPSFRGGLVSKSELKQKVFITLTIDNEEYTYQSEDPLILSNKISHRPRIGPAYTTTIDSRTYYPCRVEVNQRVYVYRQTTF
jgi:hypothetical protein